MWYVIQQIVQSVINNHLLLMSLLYVLKSKRSLSGKYIQRYTGTANTVKDICGGVTIQYCKLKLIKACKI